MLKKACLIGLGLLCVVGVLFIKYKRKESNNKTKNILLEQFKMQDNGTTKNYKIKKYDFEGEEGRVLYPQIEECDDKISNKWNTIIKDRVNDEVNSVENKKNYSLNYEIATQNEEMLSIVFKGVSHNKKDEPYYFVYTYNIDMKTGENKKLSDFVFIDKLATEVYTGKGYKLLNKKNKNFYEYILKFFDSEEELKILFKDYDYDISKTYSSGYSYVKNKKIVLCMEVNHDLNDYVEIELEDDLKK